MGFRVKMMGLVVLALLVSASGESTARAEDWKEKSNASDLSFGALSGIGIVRSSAGLAVLGTASKKILPKGFISDLSNAVWLESELGAVFLISSPIFMYSVHIRWDFIRDEKWSFYALGGLGGTTAGLSPRFGIGTFIEMKKDIRLRAEVAHDFIGVGVNIQF